MLTIVLDDQVKQDRSKLIVVLSGILFIIASSLVLFVLSAKQLPVMVYPDLASSRPFELIPALLYFISMIVLYIWVLPKNNTFFTRCLLLCLIPFVAAQLYSAFGSTALFDNHFNIAHVIKIIGDIIPLVGLSLAYINAFKKEVAMKSLFSTLSQEVSVQVEEHLRQMNYHERAKDHLRLSKPNWHRYRKVLETLFLLLVRQPGQ